MLPAPIHYLHIVISNNVQMSWSTKYQTRQDATVQRDTAQQREVTLRMGPRIPGMFRLVQLGPPPAHPGTYSASPVRHRACYTHNFRCQSIFV